MERHYPEFFTIVNPILVFLLFDCSPVDLYLIYTIQCHCSDTSATIRFYVSVKRAERDYIYELRQTVWNLQ